MNRIETLVSLLMYGEKNAITAKQLSGYMDIPYRQTGEEVRLLVRDAIRRGELIGSSSRGFFLIENQEELFTVINKLQQRIRGLMKRRSDLAQAMRMREKI